MQSTVKYKKFEDVSDGDSESPSKKNEKHFKSTPKCLLIGTLLIVALVAAISALAIGIGVGVAVSRSNDQTAPRGLSTVTVTEQQLEGYYYGGNGGIYFLSTANSTHFVVSITTTNGQRVFFVVNPVVLNMTIMSVNDTNFMIMDNQTGYTDYLIPREYMNTMESVLKGQTNMTDELMRHLDNTTVNETRVSVLQRLATSPEAILIIEAAQALGNSGIQGSDYPSAMHFYLLAVRLANLQENGNSVTTTKTQSSIMQRRKRAQTCSNGATSCARCPFPKGDNNCFGLCGKGCSCWSFVCGDCCLHQFCLSHDQCCADNGFFSIPCLSVVWSKIKCGSNYDC